LKIFFEELYQYRQLSSLIFGSLVFLFGSLSLEAAPKPKILQDLSFGTFSTSSTGGTVTVPSVGSRSATGGIFLVQTDPGAPAIMQVNFNNANLVTITVGNIANLTNGSGGSMTLQINDFYPASPFTPIPGNNNINIGGTLTVGPAASTPPGNYSGSFDITFNGQ
jgi:hypothetical protein